MSPQHCTWCNNLLPAPGVNNDNSPNASLTGKQLASSPCQTCKSATYCSAPCSSSDILHHTLCSNYATFMASTPRPSPSHKLAVLLPSDLETPRFIWINTRLHRQKWESALFEDHLGPDQPNAQSICTTEDVTRSTSASCTKEQLSNSGSTMPKCTSTLVVDIRSSYAEDGSLQNYCIEKLIPTELAQQWRGPVVISLKTGASITSPAATAGVGQPKPPFYSDFKLSDLNKLQSFLQAYQLPGKDTVQGVRLHYQGEALPFKKPALSVALIPQDHAMFNNSVNNNNNNNNSLGDSPSTEIDTETIIPISRSLGIPILIHRAGKASYNSPYSSTYISNYQNQSQDQQLTTSPQKQTTIHSGNHFNHNPSLTHLTLDTIPRSPTWGSSTSSSSCSPTGTVLLARLDKKPLTPRQVEALVCYCKDVLYNAIDKVKREEERMAGKGEKSLKLREQMSARLVNKKSFERYFEILKEVKGVVDGEWWEEKSLFD
ncbi:hypothetical protein ONS95_002001 [Cadophora gregata]|uniref:uncharacterized protein n=1 Tax=Cadophora gregata TaxID=51156 RepID=UPI0026DB19BC|nr:uncharacterized protein ONS95_002001 [Cadophora gregata]KAK0111656.1 hypothetical protein ONS95_002001 [Cadophora gregata]KAK0111868.1 hypothetical protein ONS96_001136 [Cadophora gregata f. sp. sojae]